LKNIPLLGALVWPKLIVSTHNGEGKAVVLLENDLSVTLKKNIDGSGLGTLGYLISSGRQFQYDNDQETNRLSFFKWFVV
jgi:hypothetical protein